MLMDLKTAWGNFSSAMAAATKGFLREMKLMVRVPMFGQTRKLILVNGT